MFDLQIFRQRVNFFHKFTKVGLNATSLPKFIEQISQSPADSLCFFLKKVASARWTSYEHLHCLEHIDMKIHPGQRGQYRDRQCLPGTFLWEMKISGLWNGGWILNCRGESLIIACINCRGTPRYNLQRCSYILRASTTFREDRICSFISWISLWEGTMRWSLHVMESFKLPDTEQNNLLMCIPFLWTFMLDCFVGYISSVMGMPVLQMIP